MHLIGPCSAPALFLLSTIAALASCMNGQDAPVTVAPRVVATLPRDTADFTQGLFYHNGRLYESHGLYGRSGLAVIDAHAGSPIRRIAADPGVFAEGCTRYGDEIVQLTWREQSAQVYSLSTLAPVRSLMYAGEGWGLTSDGRLFYMSSGSDTISVRNGEFSIVGTIPVRSGKTAVTKINELEWANGKLYANIWYSDKIAEINPKNGRVLRWIDCSGIVEKERPPSPDHVLNGIAYDRATQTFYLTGKKWKNIYVVRL
jgi:glutamine cyclotransferase